MAVANFKCPDTGRLYYVNAYETKLRDGKFVYMAFNKVLVGPKGSPLESIARADQREDADELITGGVKIEQSQEAYNKQAAHFKQRAKKHGQSEEAKALKKKVTDTQFGVMGLEKK